MGLGLPELREGQYGMHNVTVGTKYDEPVF
jgi:hypothetical protein